MQKIIISAAIALTTLTIPNFANAYPTQVAITSYDVINTRPSGFGNWFHSYNGSTTPTGTGLVNETGGSGALNDGLFGAVSVYNISLTGPQLILMSDPTNIILNFSSNVLLDSMSLFGGDFTGNNAPGTLTGAKITINGISTQLLSTSFIDAAGFSTNDLFNFTGTALQGLSTNQLTISNFTGGWFGSVSIAEITVNGNTVSTVPVAGTVWLFGSGLLGLLGFNRRRNIG